MNQRRLAFARLISVLFIAVPVHVRAAYPFSPVTPGDEMLVEYFKNETAKVAQSCLAEIKTLEDWKNHREKYRQQLFEMLSLSPLPEKTDLKAMVTGKVEHEAFTVEKLHFQSLPGLYVTANLYLPRELQKPAPTILYLSGHGPVISNGISYGNKVAYQHHGAWFARNGYICLILDTLQLGEILGLHHGTHREGMWWWNSRGYTPAGVEAWNSIRALDYLETRAEVDPKRLGATGRSGGGAYSWWIAALDERIKAAAPVAGITDLHNHVVDGVVEGHCDCMFTVNTYRWDYAQVAALVAPRPLLIVNTDNDTIFPLDGVMRTHDKVRHIYQLHRAATNLGVVIGPGPHKDTQDLQVPVFRWFNRHLKGEDPVIETAAVKFFQPEDLRVFNTLPDDSVNTNIHATFVPTAKHPSVPPDQQAWQQQRDTWLSLLREKSFAGWPSELPPLDLKQKFSVVRNGVRFQAYDFSSQPNMPLRLYLAHRENLKKPDRILLTVMDATGQSPIRSRTGKDATLAQGSSKENSPASGDRQGSFPAFEEWLAIMETAFPKELTEERMAIGASTNQSERVHSAQCFERFRASLQTNKTIMAFIAPRGIGLTTWNPDARKQVQIRRRFMLLGQTLASMRVWDTRRAVQAFREIKGMKDVPLWLQGQREAAINNLYAALFEPGIAGLELYQLPKSHENGPDYLNVLRVLDVPQAVAMAAERCSVRIQDTDEHGWDFAAAVETKLGWKESQFELSPLIGAK